MCHIHRPKIIDARGAWCWGSIQVASDILRITIPEQWLSEAVYPVVVDPTIGSTTIGSQIKWYDEETKKYYDLILTKRMIFNKYKLPDTMPADTECKAYIYSYRKYKDNDGAYPCIYSDTRWAGGPDRRLTWAEEWIDLVVPKSTDAGWKTRNFYIRDTIQSGTTVHFGMATNTAMLPRWDETDYALSFEGYYDKSGTCLPDKVSDISFPENWKLSMYFTYERVAQNYQCRLFSGVGAGTVTQKSAGYNRRANEQCTMNDVQFWEYRIIRKIYEGLKVIDSLILKQCAQYFREIYEYVRCDSRMKSLYTIVRRIYDWASGYGWMWSSFFLTRLLKDKLKVKSKQRRNGLYRRTVDEITVVRGNLRKSFVILRLIMDRVENSACVKASWKFIRLVLDDVEADSSAGRRLFIVIRLAAGCFVKSKVLGSLLRAQSEICVKSKITRVMELESRMK
jgi:hypothetical protein